MPSAVRANGRRRSRACASSNPRWSRLPAPAWCIVPEILQFQGSWPDALIEACRACERARARRPQAARRRVLSTGRDSSPARGVREGGGRVSRRERTGMRAATGSRAAAVGARTHRRGVRGDPPADQRHDRSSYSARELLPAHLEIMLATGDVEDARGPAMSCKSWREAFDTDVLRAVAAQAEGAIALAEGHAARRSNHSAARSTCGSASRLRMRPRGCGCSSAARVARSGTRRRRDWSTTRRGPPSNDSAPGRIWRRLEAPIPSVEHALGHPLTTRELEVLRLIANGRTNKEIADDVVPERANDRPARQQYPRASSTSLPARPPRPTPTIRSSSDRPAWRELPNRSRRLGGFAEAPAPALPARLTCRRRVAMNTLRIAAAGLCAALMFSPAIARRRRRPRLERNHGGGRRRPAADAHESLCGDHPTRRLRSRQRRDGRIHSRYLGTVNPLARRLRRRGGRLRRPMAYSDTTFPIARHSWMRRARAPSAGFPTGPPKRAASRSARRRPPG